MAFIDTVKTGITTAVDTVSGVTQTIIEKNRANAQLNRLRAVMKSECEQQAAHRFTSVGKSFSALSNSLRKILKEQENVIVRL